MQPRGGITKPLFGGPVLLTLLVMVLVSGCVAGGLRTCARGQRSTAIETAGKIPLPARPLSGLPPVVFPCDGTARTWEPVSLPPDGCVRGLTIADAGRQAAAASASARALDQEADRYARTREGSNTITAVLRMQACQVRNDTSAEAMKGWLELLRTGLQHDVLIRSADQLVQTRRTVERLRAEGLARTADVGTFDREQNGLDDRQAQLARGEQDLSGLLEYLLDIAPDSGHLLAADATGLANWRPLAPPSVEEAVQKALTHRQDLAILERLAASQDVRTLEAARQALKDVHPLIASAIERNFAGGPLKRLRLRSQLQGELDTRRQQLCGIIEATRDRIRLEVETALRAIERHQRGVELRASTLDSLSRSLDLLERQSGVREISLEERTDLQTRFLETESELVDQLVLREQAWVQLLKAQGCLGNTGGEARGGSLPLEQHLPQFFLE